MVKVTEKREIHTLDITQKAVINVQQTGCNWPDATDFA